MKIWRPENRLDWWMAFIASVLLIPLGLGFIGIKLADFGFPYMLLLALLFIPLAGTYLLFVTKLHIVIRIILALALNFALLGAFQPRTNCAGYKDEETTAKIAGHTSRPQTGCS